MNYRFIHNEESQEPETAQIPSLDDLFEALLKSKHLGKFRVKYQASLTSRRRDAKAPRFLPPTTTSWKKLTLDSRRDGDTADFCSLNRIGGCKAVKGTAARHTCYHARPNPHPPPRFAERDPMSVKSIKGRGQKNSCPIGPLIKERRRREGKTDHRRIDQTVLAFPAKFRITTLQQSIQGPLLIFHPSASHFLRDAIKIEFF